MISLFSLSKEAKGSSNKINLGFEYKTRAKHTLLVSPKL